MAQWSVPIDQIAAKQKENMTVVFRKITFMLFRAVIMRSPVDTGRFRANWNVSWNTVDDGTSENTNWQARMGGELKKIDSMPLGGIAYLANGLPYAMVLEYGQYPNPPKAGEGKTAGGYSTQAPEGMVRVTAREVAQYLQDAIRK